MLCTFLIYSITSNPTRNLECTTKYQILLHNSYNSPVTLGSKVPECPVFSSLRIRLIHDTTSCEEGLLGLSKLMNPAFRYSDIVRFKGEHPCGKGV